MKTFIFCSVTFSPENHAVYEIVWKNMQEPDRPHVTLTNTHSECVILIAFLRQIWLHERASVLRLYVHCMSPFVSVVCNELYLNNV